MQMVQRLHVEYFDSFYYRRGSEGSSNVLASNLSLIWFSDLTLAVCIHLINPTDSPTAAGHPSSGDSIR